MTSYDDYFIGDFESGEIWSSDGFYKFKFDGYIVSNFMGLLSLLNCLHKHYEKNKKLQKENEELKSDLKYWSQTAEARLKEIDKLRKDNEELKQYNKDLKEGLKDAEKRIEVQKWQLQVYREKESDLKQRLFEAKRDYLMETSDISDALYIDEEMEQLRKEVYDI